MTKILLNTERALTRKQKSKTKALLKFLLEISVYVYMGTLIQNKYRGISKSTEVNRID